MLAYIDTIFTDDYTSRDHNEYLAEITDFAHRKRLNLVVFSAPSVQLPSFYIESIKFGMRTDVYAIITNGWLHYSVQIPPTSWKNEILFSYPIFYSDLRILVMPTENGSNNELLNKYRIIADKYHYTITRSYPDIYDLFEKMSKQEKPPLPGYVGVKNPDLMFFADYLPGTLFETFAFAHHELLNIVKRYLPLIDDFDWKVAFADTRTPFQVLNDMGIDKAKILCFGYKAAAILKKAGIFDFSFHLLNRRKYHVRADTF